MKTGINTLKIFVTFPLKCIKMLLTETLQFTKLNNYLLWRRLDFISLAFTRILILLYAANIYKWFELFYFFGIACWLLISIITGKVTAYRAIQAQSGSRSTDTLILNHSHTSAALPSGNSTGGLFELGTVLDGCGKFRPHRDSNIKLSSQYLPVQIRSFLCFQGMCCVSHNTEIC